MRVHSRLVLAALSVLTVSLLATGASAAPPNGKWPGGPEVSTADGANVFGGNLSGLAFQSPGVVWAVKNGPGTLYRLVPDGAGWRPDPSGGWASGKALRYRDGKGDPDAEGVTVTPDGVFAATERNGDNGKVSLAKILRFDPASTSSSLNATAEWDLTADLPKVAANSGPEAITWVPDSVLTARGFLDERTKAPYRPDSYPGHGSGLYFVGLENNGVIYAYALNQSGSGYTRVAAIPSGLPAIMGLEFEADTGRVWATCDNTCSGRSATLEVRGGKFTATATYDRPTQLANLNNEGFAIAPPSTCAGGRKAVLWADDGNTGGHALRRGTLPCTAGG
ncbi:MULTISPECIES: hypothetical protein [unclassified Crossiella]|uniref:hypothetical protein n=1 Tax=unclassified Crossiella TaxID=2620835 RepID=UPI001FFF1BD6|nr:MULTISPECIES: hypothetical protein [unclassified Crossiella]MCK2244431.1 hypothetical protein [Crossiella sp. S99.2]MCK2257741.1 hypothetical protein [Crossiella sp. S99.1]